jgi:tetraacyldisaccharide 4'-kinase
MILPSAFYDLASGRRRGLAAMLLRGALRVAEVPYGTAVAWRNHRFDRGAAKIHYAKVPVISVGNLTVGGTGKTPLVKWIARRFHERDVKVAILSRGYGARNGRPNDEALELAADFPEIPHLQCRDRVASAAAAVEQIQIRALLLDDGFQHRRLHRNLDIVLLDALAPFGYSHLLPRGTLREPLVALRRADVVVLSRADLIDKEARSQIRRLVHLRSPQAAWCEICFMPTYLINAVGERLHCKALAGRRVSAFCGIGSPAGFRATLDSNGLQVASWREFPDHHAYSCDDLGDLAARCSRDGISTLVCTRKDLVKIQQTHLGDIPLWALAVEARFLDGEEELCRLLDLSVCGAPTATSCLLP